MAEFIAIEINSPEVWEIACALEPHFKELDAEFNLGNFIVLNYPNENTRWSIMSPDTVAKYFHHIQHGRTPHIKILQMVE